MSLPVPRRQALSHLLGQAVQHSQGFPSFSFLLRMGEKCVDFLSDSLIN